jgi:copper resistance protein C
MARVKHAVLAAIVFSLTVIAPAQANSLVSTSPAVGSILVSAPSAVTLTTQAPLADIGNTVTVTNPVAARVDDGTITVDGMNVIVGLQPLTVTGLYTVAYTLLTANDVPLVGTFTFSFTAPTVISSPSPTSSAATTITPTAGSGRGTAIFVLVLLFVAFLVFIFLIFYARKLIRGR